MICHLQAHAHEGEDHAPGQVDALHGDVEEGEGEHDHHQAEVHVFERILELARLLEHAPSHLPMHQQCDNILNSFVFYVHQKEIVF